MNVDIPHNPDNPHELFLTFSQIPGGSLDKDGTKVMVGLIEFQINGKGNIIRCYAINGSYFEVKN